MKKVGIIGWRGMVGSVLIDRMRAENDFSKFDSYFYSTSQVGQAAPKEAQNDLLIDAYDLDSLADMDAIITCQGGDYTKKVFSDLRSKGWNGHWVDAASTLRMSEDSIIVLDPVNDTHIRESYNKGIKNFIGGNCTVSLMLMAVGSLFNEGLVEWVSSMTYQAASGAGAKNMKELLRQMEQIGQLASKMKDDSILDIDKSITSFMNSNEIEQELFGVPLGGSLIPWIDSKVDKGQTREEWKGISETNKIINSAVEIPIDGTCVRIGALRCHSQALTIKLNKNLPITEIEHLIKNSNEWVRFVPNEVEETKNLLTPTSVSGKLDIAVGRVRKMNIGENYLNVFTVGDQLLWGAAEPIRRALNFIINEKY